MSHKMKSPRVSPTRAVPLDIETSLRCAGRLRCADTRGIGSAAWRRVWIFGRCKSERRDGSDEEEELHDGEEVSRWNGLSFDMDLGFRAVLNLGGGLSSDDPSNYILNTTRIKDAIDIFQA